MSDDKPTIEEAREIIKVRRVSAKPTPEKKNDETEAAKAREAEFKKRLRRLQIFLGAAVLILFLLGLRALGCFSPSRTPTSDPRSFPAAIAFPSDFRVSPPKNDATPPEFRRLFSPEPILSDLTKTSTLANATASSRSLDDLRVVRIATWNLEPLVFSKVTNLKQGEKIAEIIRQFDVVAVQGIRSKNRAVLEGLVYLVARQGGEYDYIASTSPSREPISAIFFNVRTIAVDRSSISEVYDARGRLRTPALAANFRPNEVAAESCFTFQIINLHLFGEETDGAALVDLLETLKKRAGGFGLSEDDLIVAGDFGADIQKIKELEKLPTFSALHLDRDAENDDEKNANLLFDSVASVEYVDRFGIVDLAEFFDISEEAADEIAQNRPVWADFSVYEGGAPDFFAPRPPKSPR
ncbi:MAG: hypothetical protein IKU86_09780 [Thermoguttaceae bacterium]|nr:hypothetical protein [Thermoguttaceae bacterium]